MKRLVVVLLILGGAFLGWQRMSGAAPSKTFERFAEAWARGRNDDAMKLADGDAVHRTLYDKDFVRQLCPPWQVDAFHGFRTSVVSSSKNAAGDLDLEVEQAIAFDPPGATSGIGGAALAKFRHAATLRKTPDGWKVVAFTPKCESVTLARDRR